VRERLIKARTALVNEIRGLLSEYGVVLPHGMRKCRTSVVRQLEAAQAKLTPLSTEGFPGENAKFCTLGHSERHR
jgi:transposase